MTAPLLRERWHAMMTKNLGRRPNMRCTRRPCVS